MMGATIISPTVAGGAMGPAASEDTYLGALPADGTRHEVRRRRCCCRLAAAAIALIVVAAAATVVAVELRTR